MTARNPLGPAATCARSRTLAGAVATAALALAGAGAGAQDLHPASGEGELVELRRSYVVLLEGEQQGTVDQTLRRHPADIPYEGLGDVADHAPLWESTSTMSAPMQQQERRLVFAEDGLRPLLLEQWETRDRAGPEVSLRVSEGRATGRVALAGDEPPRELDVDLPDGSLLPGMDDYLLAGAELAPGDRFGAPMLDLAEGGVTTVTFRVEEEVERVEVPAGVFETLRVTVEGGPQPLSLLVKRDPPHVAVRQEFPGRPLALELTHLTEGRP